MPVTWTRGGSGVVGEWLWSGVQERSGPVVLCKCGGSEDALSVLVLSLKPEG